MGYASWLLVVAAGAILRYAINDNVKDVNLATIGLILIIVGIVGFVISFIAYASRRREVVAVQDRVVTRDPRADV